MKTETLDSLLQEVINMPSVAFAHVWRPTPEELAEYAADGIDAKPCLEVVIWRGEPNTTMAKCLIQDLGLRCVGEGSNCLGPCFSFVLAAE